MHPCGLFALLYQQYDITLEKIKYEDDKVKEVEKIFKIEYEDIVDKKIRNNKFNNSDEKGK